MVKQDVTKGKGFRLVKMECSASSRPLPLGNKTDIFSSPLSCDKTEEAGPHTFLHLGKKKLKICSYFFLNVLEVTGCVYLLPK